MSFDIFVVTYGVTNFCQNLWTCLRKKLNFYFLFSPIFGLPCLSGTLQCDTKQCIRSPLYWLSASIHRTTNVFKAVLTFMDYRCPNQKTGIHSKAWMPIGGNRDSFPKSQLHIYICPTMPTSGDPNAKRDALLLYRQAPSWIKPSMDEAPLSRPLHGWTAPPPGVTSKCVHRYLQYTKVQPPCSIAWFSNTPLLFQKKTLLFHYLWKAHNRILTQVQNEKQDFLSHWISLNSVSAGGVTYPGSRDGDESSWPKNPENSFVDLQL